MLLGTKLFTQRFIIADVKSPILGADLFGDHALSNVVANQKLVGNTGYSIECVADGNNVIANVSIVAVSRFDAVMAEYSGILTLQFFDAMDMAHGIRHFIPTEAPPVF